MKNRYFNNEQLEIIKNEQLKVITIPGLSTKPEYLDKYIYDSELFEFNNDDDDDEKGEINEIIDDIQDYLEGVNESTEEFYSKKPDDDKQSEEEEGKE